MTALPDGWFNVLKHRSVADKIAVPINCAMADPATLPVIAMMVREGIVQWIDRRMAWAKIRHHDLPEPTRIEFPIDVYRLTAKGIALCEANEIEQV